MSHQNKLDLMQELFRFAHFKPFIYEDLIISTISALNCFVRLHVLLHLFYSQMSPNSKKKLQRLKSCCQKSADDNITNLGVSAVKLRDPKQYSCQQRAIRAVLYCDMSEWFDMELLRDAIDGSNRWKSR